MRRLTLVLLVAMVALAGCASSHSAPKLVLVPVHSTVEAKFRFTPPPSCISPDCGAYAETLAWGTIPFANTTGFNVFINASKIADVTSSPYTFTGLDCGTTFTLGVQAHDGSGNVGQTYSEPYTTPPCSPPPINSVLPAITGTAQQGATLNASNGTWLNNPTGFTYQWERCASSCTNISSATASSYSPGSPDVGDTIQVAVTATNAFGSALATSAPTATVTAASSGQQPLLATGSQGAPANAAPWTQVFDDEFNGTSIDTSRWEVYNDPQTGCPGTAATCHIDHSNDGANPSTADCTEGPVNPGGTGTVGALTLTVPGDGTGCNISSAWGGAGSYNSPDLTSSGANSFELAIGDYVEYRVWFPACPGCNSGFDPIANHPGVWTSGSNWPANGEIDVAEGLAKLSTTYHECSGTPVVGCGSTSDTTTFSALTTWGGAWHTYGVYRTATDDYVYWDGNLMADHKVNDLGGLQALRISMGLASNNLYAVTGSAGNMYVDWVRAYTP